MPISTKQLIYWLDRLWEEHLCDSSGNPRVRVHGFGLTSLPLMKRYPWFSVDSSTWVQNAANGMVLIPGHGTMTVSSRSPNRKMKGQHMETFTAPQTEAIKEYFRSLGFDPDRLADEYISRWAFNCWAFVTEGKIGLIDNFEKQQPTFF